MLAPVVPAHLPQLGTFRLQDYRGLATHRFGIVSTPVCVLVGKLSHVALDSLTHGWGWSPETSTGTTTSSSRAPGSVGR